VILHGLCTYGFGARALISAISNNDPAALRYYNGRFVSPVKPGDKLQTSAWKLGPGPNGTTEIVFEVKDLTSGKVRCLVLVLKSTSILTVSCPKRRS